MRKRIIWMTSILFIGCCLLYFWPDQPDALIAGTDWPTYGGNKQGNRYSPLDQINTENVHNLEIAWMYNAAVTREGAIQCQPIVIDGILYGTTPELNLFALHADTGEEIWKFLPEKKDRPHQSRGLMYWENGEDQRILYTVGAGLYAVDAKNGKAVQDFGKNGRANLKEGLQTNMDHDVSKLSVNATSPGVIYQNTLIIGSATSEGGNAAPGHIRAFDVLSGELVWVFHTIPQPGEFGYDTWPKDAYKKIGAANSWSGMTLDEERGIVFFGTGSPASDFYGADRQGANLFANCILALDALTGEMKWYYQTIHHDLWDRDHACPPNLATVKHYGKNVDVVVQATKDGLIYVLDRENGTSLFPVEERAVPTNGLPGEHPYPTQKYPLKPAPFARQVFTEDDITDLSPEAHAFVKERFLQIKTDNKFAPPSTDGTLLFGYSGGAQWGGNAIDPNGVLYQNSNEEPWELVMYERNTIVANKGQSRPITQGNALYLTHCASCHGKDRKGSGPELPSLIDINKKMPLEEIKNLIQKGGSRMPSFHYLSEKERDSILGFITQSSADTIMVVTQPVAKGLDEPDSANGFPYIPAYVSNPWKRFTDQDGYPGVKPPWGTLNAIDLNTGEYLWRVPLGEYPELADKGIPITGTTSYGGPIVTAGGLVIIAGTKDEKIRAFDKSSGKILWEFQLPAGGFATPITYEVDGRQYIVIAAGGGREQKLGGSYIAFTLK
ncbi:outer membrane protein assembly factor BamB family protein [Cyclobacterium plantarum]|uniref:PQQ-binding-like beta-propeller repeat protein n=1 Tax=Cyclobacterium plantarum TaxID=2716263 RepID=A0ABX0HEE0_9BACT|nr:PQQ-binding-like beta-propeller repeat protein [Cyclobacterium plantarum]NHE58698.1 PQQ-binding-like beta-propeller repeat protein [Cyclobacterium plantarum]